MAVFPYSSVSGWGDARFVETTLLMCATDRPCACIPLQQPNTAKRCPRTRHAGWIGQSFARVQRNAGRRSPIPLRRTHNGNQRCDRQLLTANASTLLKDTQNRQVSCTACKTLNCPLGVHTNKCRGNPIRGQSIKEGGANCTLYAVDG